MDQPQQRNECPICGKPPVYFQPYGNRDASQIKCERCGDFAMSRTLIVNLKGRTEEEARLLPYLSAYTRQASGRGGVIELNSGNWLEFARSRANTAVQTKNTKLLDLVASRSRHPGELVPISIDCDYPMVDAATPEELEFFLSHLMNRGLIDKRDVSYRLTVDGWQLVDSKASKPSGSGHAFVAMAFDPTLEEAYELGIRRAIKQDCGFTAIRVDKVQHNEKICDRILMELRRASFAVADFTLHRNGCYFEAGFAMALGIPVVFACRGDQLKDTHFDTRQYNHIVWEDSANLRAKLAGRIQATIMTGVQP
jgi:nucleoside 2-deoxyribosyltransferase